MTLSVCEAPLCQDLCCAVNGHVREGLSLQGGRGG